LLPLQMIVDDVFENMRLQADQVKLRDEVPSKLIVDADREQLSRMLTNLVRNAIQAIETRPKTKDEIRISAAREGKLVLITVADTGPGIPPAIKGKMFEAFQTAARQGGTGLGLAISAELAKAHGGGIAVAQSNEQGTIFEISLPDRNGHENGK